MKTGFFPNFPRHSILLRLAPVHIASHQNISRLSVLLDQKNLSSFFIRHNHADRHIVHRETVLLALRTVWNNAFSLQFFSRGCIRKCPFCLVREKEGYIRAVEPVELNPEGKWIEVLDNNFFANPQ